jgi:hypothetical protein
MLKTLVIAVVGALVLSGLGLAGSQSETYTLSARLTAGAEVPKPKGVPASATESFKGATVELKTGTVKLTWKLAFAHLSGKALQAHSHLGKRGTSGNVLVALCAPCRERTDGQGRDRTQHREGARGGEGVRQRSHREESGGRDPRPDRSD